MNETNSHVCPFTKADITSHAIRRKDLLDLSTSFRESLSPLGDLVACMRKQLLAVDRLQAWLFVLVGLASLGFLLTFFAIWYISTIAVDMARTAEKLDDLESRLEIVYRSTQRAATAAEAAQRSTQAIASAQASAALEPRVELVPETDPVKARSTPILLRVTSRPVPSPSAGAPVKASVTLPVGR